MVSLQSLLFIDLVHQDCPSWLLHSVKKISGAGCQFTGFNDSFNWGAGACLDWGSSMSFTDCTFSDNSNAIRSQNGGIADVGFDNRSTDVRVEGGTFINSKKPDETHFMSLNPSGDEGWNSSYYTDWNTAKMCVYQTTEEVCELEDIKTLEAADQRDAAVSPGDRVFLRADDDVFMTIKEVCRRKAACECPFAQMQLSLLRGKKVLR